MLSAGRVRREGIALRTNGGAGCTPENVFESIYIGNICAFERGFFSQLIMRELCGRGRRVPLSIQGSLYNLLPSSYDCSTTASLLHQLSKITYVYIYVSVGLYIYIYIYTYISISI